MVPAHINDFDSSQSLAKGLSATDRTAQHCKIGECNPEADQRSPYRFAEKEIIEEVAQQETWDRNQDRINDERE